MLAPLSVNPKDELISRHTLRMLWQTIVIN